MSTLPIDTVLPQLRQTLDAHTRAVLQAPPGAGKTTRVPLALLDAPWLRGRKIIMLEPRRLATRSAAHFMARCLGEAVGQRVGYRVRLDTRVGPNTRIEVVTEGILTRMLQRDPALEEVGIVIFDEFHERNLQADLGLALCLEAQAALREELRILVMSATLDGAAVSALLGDAPLIRSEGRCYPVAIRHASPSSGRARGLPPLAQVVPVVLKALEQESGSILVFLPGAREIKRIESQLRAAVLPDDVVLTPLYGNLPQEVQDRAIAPAPPGQRKVVLATNIAETSLTIEGIRIVVDVGLVRVPTFELRSGMTRLETVQVSQASADQRSGRAGRLEPGVCYRLWPEGLHLVPHGEPEIRTADLAALVLELAQWGSTDPTELVWLDPPPEASVAQARTLLMRLGALDRQGRITAHGEQIARLPLHPRLAHMVIKGQALGLGALACDLAALLSERDVLRSASGPKGRREADIHQRLLVLLGDQVPEVDRGALKHVRESARQWRQALKIGARSDHADLAMAGVLLGFAYPDRIAQRREGGGQRFLLSNGRGAAFISPDALAEADYLVVAQLDGAEGEARIFLAAELTLTLLQRHFGEQMEVAEFVRWDSGAEAVSARRQTRLGALVLQDKTRESVDPEVAVEAMLEGLGQMGIAALPWSKQSRQWQARVQFLHRLDGEAWPDVSDAALEAGAAQWLAPFLHGISRRSHLQRIDLMAALTALLSWQQQRQLETLAPTHISVPSGSRIAIDYASQPPVLAVRLQEMLGAQETPAIAGGRVRLLLHLLSPARRPLQVTQDLAGFWQGSYHEVKKEMKGRYPKHFWPDDPGQALPTARAKPRPK
ncbi:MAG TPA: ATP-dependent helicase HrpB [Candidatus Tenderia sp.]|nr:ATP-dependent helicase HrpB [Candidatus Tenderia sp.]